METFDIPVENMMSAFEAHLNDENGENNRILFSGPFGCGKTFFLNKFFKKNSQIYRSFHLFPVNYQVSSNQDIFKLLKYDILLKLIEHNLINDEKDVSKLQSMKRFIGGNGKDVALDFLETLPQIGGFISAGKKLKEFAEKYNEEQAVNSEEKYIESIIDQLQGQEGSIYELDNLTAFISKKLAEKDDYKNVLIIDDLDRIDPEHIFRILNLLTAHIDNQNYSSIEQKNKFGFDKIIIVCDVENIRQIFHERYGQNVNFSGYIDKFYSKTIFEYNIKEEVRNHLRYIIKPFLEANERDRPMVHLLQGFCEPILEKFVMEGAVQIREIEKLYHSPREEFDDYYLVFPGYQFHNKSFDYFPLVGFFLHVFNYDLKKLSKALDLCSYKKSATKLNVESRNAVKGYLFGMFLPFVNLIDFSQLQKKVSLYEEEGEKFYFKVVSTEDVRYRDKYRTAFVENESSKAIDYSEIEVSDQSIFKAWRKALKATHGI